MTELQANGPFFVPPYEPRNGGVDFLGLRQANLDLMALCLPGINNVTSYLRPFSVLAWIHWKFHQLLEQGGTEQASSKQLTGFRECVETLFTWGHVLNGVRGIPGTDAKVPAGENGVVPLDFATWKKRPENTSLMAAVQYGPATKTLGGLGFLEQVDIGLYRACTPGIALAEALEQSLEQSVADYGGTNPISLDLKAASEAEAKRLFVGWNIEKPTEAERAVFRSVFFDAGRIGRNDAMGRRSATLALAFAVLEWANGPLEVEQIRRSMVYLRAPGLEPMSLPAELEAARWRWSALQLRQTQRLAFESLLVWIEAQLDRPGAHEGEDLVQLAGKALDHELTEASSGTLGALWQACTGSFSDFEAACASAIANDDHCQFKLRERLSQAMADQDENALLVSAMRALMLCASIAQTLERHPVASQAMQTGGQDRISISRWRQLAERGTNQPLQQFLLTLFEEMVLSQHFAVAAGRFDGGTQRLRISIEEEGLTLLTNERWWPQLTPDRLPRALDLSAECSLLKWNPAGTFETPGD